MKITGTFTIKDEQTLESVRKLIAYSDTILYDWRRYSDIIPYHLLDDE